MAVNDPFVIGLYGRPGASKTTQVIAAMGWGRVITTAKSNVVSAETFLGVRVDAATDFEVKVCSQLGALPPLLNGSPAVPAADGKPAKPAVPPLRNTPFLIDDMGVMADGFINKMRPFCTNAKGMEDTRKLFGSLSDVTVKAVAAIRDAQERGCDGYLTSHYRGCKKNEQGSNIIPQDGAKLGFYMPSEGNIEKIAEICRTMVGVLGSHSEFPGPVFKCDRAHPYEWYKNHLNVFEPVGPAGLSEYLRHAGRPSRRIKGTEWMEDFVSAVADMLRDETDEETIMAWLLTSGVEMKQHRRWIYQDGWTRNWLGSDRV